MPKIKKKLMPWKKKNRKNKDADKTTNKKYTQQDPSMEGNDTIPTNKSILTSYSLGTGIFPKNGQIHFASKTREASLSTTTTTSVTATDDSYDSTHPPITTTGSSTGMVATFLKDKCVYLRTADLGLFSTMKHLYNNNTTLHPHFHHPSQDPPPGVDHDPNEHWVALDNGEGIHAPIAPYAVESLAKSGLESAMTKRSMWTPNRHTERLLRNSNDDVWSDVAWKEKGRLVVPDRGSYAEKDVLVWSGGFDHGFYGSDLPTVRALGVVNMSPEAVVDLLLDSSRVHEYNKMSLGRSDELVLQDDMNQDGPFGRSVTKVVRSATKPPMVRKTLEFVTLLHARELEDGSGFLIVSRAVTQAASSMVLDGKILRSEILMGVNVIKRVEGDDNRCVMVNVNHIRSPMVPMMIAKKIGLNAASGFFNDVRALC